MAEGIAAGLPGHRVPGPRALGHDLADHAVPRIEFSAAFFFVITAAIGTIITPCMFFWPTSQEVEENQGRKTRRSLADLRTKDADGSSRL